MKEEYLAAASTSFTFLSLFLFLAFASASRVGFRPISLGSLGATLVFDALYSREATKTALHYGVLRCLFLVRLFDARSPRVPLPQITTATKRQRARATEEKTSGRTREPERRHKLCCLQKHTQERRHTLTLVAMATHRADSERGFLVLTHAARKSAPDKRGPPDRDPGSKQTRKE